MSSNIIKLFLIIFTYLLFGGVESSNAGIDFSDCQNALRNVLSDEFTCTTHVVLTEDEKKQLVKNSSDILRDLRCSVNLLIDKKKIFGEIIGKDSIAIPPQSISCNLQTNRDPLNVDFTVAPFIHFQKDGKADDAAINLDNVTGIPLFLGNILKNFVRSSLINRI